MVQKNSERRLQGWRDSFAVRNLANESYLDQSNLFLGMFALVIGNWRIENSLNVIARISTVSKEVHFVYGTPEKVLYSLRQGQKDNNNNLVWQ